MRRTLRLSKETLTELTPDDLRSVAGAALPTLDCIASLPTLDCIGSLPTLRGCLTGMYPTFDGCTS